MATDQIDPKVFQRTRDTLGKIVKKTPLSDKYLARPPFKLVRDIILEVFKTTKFFKGLYSGKELDTKVDWHRDLKLSFLQKAIDVLVFTTKKTVKARPSKIIAGAEVDKTNEFFQLLGIAILKELDSSEAIQLVLKGEKPQQTDKSKQKDSKKHKDEKKPEEKAEKKPDEPKDDEKENVEVEPPPPQPPVVSDPPAERPLNRPSTRRKTREIPKRADNEEPPEPTQGDDNLGSDGGSGSQIKLPERPTSAKGGRKSLHDVNSTSSPLLDKELGGSSQLMEDNNHESLPGLVSGIATTRPSSGRPPAPRVVNMVTDGDEHQNRISSGHDHVPPNVIMDKDDDKEDDEYVVQSSNLSSNLLPQSENIEVNTGEDSKPEGALAKTILETKERFIGERTQDNVVKDLTIDEAQRRKERGAVEKEVKTLQDSIQSLCQSANPLGKMMDYVQEDLDSMSQELEMWRKENATHAEALSREQKITEEELSPLQSQLSELEDKVAEQLDLISNMKLVIMKNEVQMKNLITSNH